MKRKERRRILLCGLRSGRKMYLVSCIKSGKSFLGCMGHKIQCFLEIHFGNHEFSYQEMWEAFRIFFLAKDVL